MTKILLYYLYCRRYDQHFLCIFYFMSLLVKMPEAKIKNKTSEIAIGSDINKDSIKQKYKDRTVLLMLK